MKLLFTLFLIIFTMIYVPGKMVMAETWIENFNGDTLENWKEYDEHFGKGIWAPETVWKTKDGMLDVWIDPPPTPGIFEIFPLEFVGFPVKANELNVKVKIHQEKNDSFDDIGILIGQHSEHDEGNDVISHTFHFLNGSFIPLNKTPFRNGVIQTPPLHSFDILEIAHQVDSKHLPLDEMEVSFKNGHFKFLSQNNLLTEFKVPQMTTIDCLGVIAYVERGGGHIGRFALDNFVISGPNVPAHGSLNVRPKDKAAVLWGELKRQ